MSKKFHTRINESPCDQCKKKCSGRRLCQEFRKYSEANQKKNISIDEKDIVEEIHYSSPKDVAIPPHISNILQTLDLFPIPYGRFSVEIRKSKYNNKIVVITRLNSSRSIYSISGKKLKKPYKLTFINSKLIKVN